MTTRIIALQDERHREVLSLLPWYVAGRLDEAEESDVRAHLALCSECQAELTAERRLAAEVGSLPLDAAAPSLGVEHGWRLMRQRLDREAQKPALLAALAAWWAARRSGAGQAGAGAPWLRWAVVAQSCLLVLLGAVAWQTSQPARYRALGAQPAPAEGNVVVMFRPETREGDLREILNASHARLVDGPTAADAYLIRVPAAERSATLATLRRRAQVVLAEPVDPAAPN